MNPLASVLGSSPFRGAAGVAGEAYLQQSQQSKGLLSLRGKLPGFPSVLGAAGGGWWLASHLLFVFLLGGIEIREKVGDIPIIFWGGNTWKYT